MVLGDLCRITMRGSLFGQEVLNVFFYRVAEVGIEPGSGYYTEALQQFNNTVWANIRQVLSSSYEASSFLLENLSDGVGYAEFVPNAPAGTVSGDALPSYVCYSVRLQLESRNARAGWKRFAGVPESKASGNNVTLSSSDITNYVDPVGDDLSLSSGLGGRLEPVVVRRPIPVVPVGTSYTYASVSGVRAVSLGSQNTRKVGRGR